jgi:predicted nucleic acid-binding protein
MCIVVDTCALSAVFNERNARHHEFAPVQEWITDGDGMVVYGGSRYLRELATAESYLKLFTELGRAKKALVIDQTAVDRHERVVQRIETSAAFDDPHIVAIVRASGCRLVCTTDISAIPFLKRRNLYGKGAKKPKIYSSASQKHLLRTNNIAHCCRKFLES